MKLTNIEMPKLHIHCQVEKNGDILHDSYQVGHSWVRNAYNLYNLMMLDSYVTADFPLRMTSGLFNASSVLPSRTFMYDEVNYGYYNALNNNTFGIVVGTGNTAFHLDDFRLDTYIAHGNSADQFSYQAQAAPVTSWTGNPDYEGNILHKRVFNNNSGASITVNEVGLVYCAYHGGYLLTSRDVLDTPVAVANGAQLTVTISITTQSLAGIADGAPAIGALGSGGIYIGQFNYSYDNQPPGSHGKYGLILALLTDGVTAGQSSALAWRTSATNTANTADGYYGAANTASLVALGADSPIGQFVTTANSGSLGGFTDWYIPANYELSIMYTNSASIPAGEECDNANYWTSKSVTTGAQYRNPITNVTGQSGQTTTYKIRLIRRFLITAWAPDA